MRHAEIPSAKSASATSYWDIVILRLPKEHSTLSLHHWEVNPPNRVVSQPNSCQDHLLGKCMKMALFRNQIDPRISPRSLVIFSPVSRQVKAAARREPRSRRFARRSTSVR